MAYHPLANDTGGTAEDRRAEASRILNMAQFIKTEKMNENERRFLNQMFGDDLQPVSTKQLFWLRDIKDKYL